MSIRRQEVARYILLPGIIPRVRDFLRAPFSFLAALFAMTFEMVRLLPRGHPYVDPANFGTFGMIDVLRAGAAHLVFDLKHIDRILIYFAVVAAWVTFLLLLFTAAAYGVMTPASAQMAESVSGLMGEIYKYTDTPNPDKDIALMLLDRTLGVTGETASGSFFGSNVPNMCMGGDLAASAGSCTPPPFPSPFHIGIHNLLGFYAWAIFCFSFLFMLYLVVTIVIEVNIKGTPFGARMNSFWTPLRLVAAIGMLVPLAPHSLNTAQYIVLYTAKMGSAFATNGWVYYNQFLKQKMGDTIHNPVGAVPKYTYDPELGPTIESGSPLAAKLNAPDMGDLVRFLHLVAACEYYYEVKSGKSIDNFNVQGYFYRQGQTPKPAYKEPAVQGKTPKNTYAGGSGAGDNFLAYKDVLPFFKNGNIRIIFGSYDEAAKDKSMGGITPLCGEMIIPVTSVDNPNTPETGNPGAAIAHQYYYSYVMGLWDKTTYPRQLMDGYARQMVWNYAKVGAARTCPVETDADGIQKDPGGATLTELGKCNDDPPGTYIQYQVEMFQSIFKTLIDAANKEIAKPENFKVDPGVLDRGWAGAGIWYQKIAQINGDYVSAVQQIPYAARLPKVMEVAHGISAMSQNNMMTVHKFFNLPKDAGRAFVPQDEELALALNHINKHLKGDAASFSFFPDPSGQAGVSGQKGYPINNVLDKQPNVLLSAVNTVLGTDFLFSFKDNANTHPLAQLVTFGRVMLERSARNLMTGSAIAAAGGLISVGNEDISTGLRKLSSFFLVIASVLFSGGFMLFYVLPLLPFVYFFFAVLSWVKAIFEGLIGAPLWAMAHVRIEGNGFPSGAARSGYLLLMEIFLRPIVTVFALLAAIGVYTGVVYFLNDTLEFVLMIMGRKNLADVVGDGQATGDIRGLIDVFFFTIMYIMLVYMLANSCFQIIDKIPNGFMRWFGQGAKSFAQITYAKDSPAKTFTSNAYVAIADPARRMIDKVDDLTYDVTSAVTSEMNKQQDGKIAEMVQRTFGKDRKTQIDEAIQKDFGSSIETGLKAGAAAKEKKKEVKQLEQEAAAASNDPALQNQLLEELKQAKADAKELEIVAQMNDPELLLKELEKPGSSGLSSDVIARARSEGRFAALEKLIEGSGGKPGISDKVWSMQQSKLEGSGSGFYADRAGVNSGVRSAIAGAKAKTLQKLKEKGEIE